MARNCLVCDAFITTVNLGIDCCRACAVFYRRARRTECKFRCRLSSNRCIQEGRVVECRRCRFDLMQAIFEQATRLILPDHTSEPEENLPPVCEHTRVPSPAPAQLSRQPCCHSSNCPSTSTTTPVLDRIRGAYKVRTRIRRAAELCMRPTDEFVHLKTIDDNSFPIIAATHGKLFALRQIELSSLFDFASIAFPSFQELSAEEKCALIGRSCVRVGIIDGTYRSMKMFPDDDRVFVSHTTTVCKDSLDVFFSDCELTVDIATAKAELRKNIAANAGRCKRAMQRADPSEEELLALMGISFWNTEFAPGDERITEIARDNRAAIMSDLHSYYTSRGMSDYAARIGELFCQLVDHESVASNIVEDIELLRLMNAHEQPRY